MKTTKTTHTGCHPQLVVKTKYVYTVQRAKMSYHPLSQVPQSNAQDQPELNSTVELPA